VCPASAPERGGTIGEKTQFTVIPTDGYGNVDSNAFQDVDKKMVPPDSLMVGTQLQGRRLMSEQSSKGSPK